MPDLSGSRAGKTQTQIIAEEAGKKAALTVAANKPQIPMPEAPAWQSMYNGITGAVDPRYFLNNPEKVTAGTYNASQLTGNYGITDPAKAQYGSVFDTAKSLYDPIKGNEASMQAFRDRALQQGPSAWLNMQLENQKLGEEDALQKTASSNTGSMNQAMSALALRGGLSGGAAQRMVRQMGQQSMLGQQDIRRQGLTDRLGLQVADENTRNEFLKALPAAEVAWLQPQLEKARALTGVKTDDTNRAYDASKFDISNQLDANKFNANARFQKDSFNTSALNDQNKFNVGNTFAADQFNADALFKMGQFNATTFQKELDAARQADMDRWKTKMQTLGAEKTADAMANSGKK
jgi:hypothetical protein